MIVRKRASDLVDDRSPWIRGAYPSDGCKRAARMRTAPVGWLLLRSFCGANRRL
jgi:hypothetical protein